MNAKKIVGITCTAFLKRRKKVIKKVTSYIIKINHLEITAATKNQETLWVVAVFHSKEQTISYILLSCS